MSRTNENAMPPADLRIDEIYLRIWEKQQESTGTRWGIITFFMSVSFALFGFSLQNPNPLIASTAQRIAGIAIYWFAYFLFHRFDDWTHLLRSYLEELETTTSTRFALQIRWKAKMQKRFCKWTSVNKLLIYFGSLYTVAVVLLWWLGV
jgi:hypothetical protein